MRFEKNKKEFRVGDIMSYKGSVVTVLSKVKMPCPFGRGLMFPEAWAFLCHFKDLPYKRKDGEFIWISGLAIVHDPLDKLRDWYERPLEYIDTEWDEKKLLHKSPEEAVADKIGDLEVLWESPLRIVCKNCKARGEECKERLKSLNLESLNKHQIPILFSSPLFFASLAKRGGWKKP